MGGLGSRFHVFCQTTSCHGFPRISNSKSLAEKIFWSVLIGCLSFILIYNTISTVSDFFDEGVRWSTEMSENIERALEHPSLLFCNYNRFKKSEVQKLKMPTNVVEHLLGSNAATHSICKRKSLTAAQAWINWMAERNLTGIEFLRTCSHKCKGMIKMLLMTVSGKAQREVPDPCEATLANHSLTKENVVVPFDFSTQCNRLLVDPTEPKYLMYSEQITACQQSCGDPCESQSITATATYTGFPVAQQLNSLKGNMPKLFGNMSIAEIQRRYILLDVYYSSGSVTILAGQMASEKFTESAVLQLGGQMGLFLGISIITIVHGLAHFCVEPARNLVEEKFLSKKPDSKSRANSVRNRRVSVVSKHGAKQ